MKRRDDVRAALREAADAIDMLARGGSPFLRMARRLRGLARRMTEDIVVGHEESICPFVVPGTNVSACWLGQRCLGSDDKSCPLQRGPVVVSGVPLNRRKR